MKLEISKDNYGMYLMDGTSVRVSINYVLSLNHLDRIQDIGFEIDIHKKKFHSDLIFQIQQLVLEVEFELKQLNKLFRGKNRDQFFSRLRLPQNALSVQVRGLTHTDAIDEVRTRNIPVFHSNKICDVANVVE